MRKSVHLIHILLLAVPGALSITYTAERAQKDDETLRFLLKKAPLVVVGEIGPQLNTYRTHEDPASKVYMRFSTFEFKVVEVLAGKATPEEKLNVIVGEFTTGDSDRIPWLKPEGKYILFLKKNEHVRLKGGPAWDTSDMWFGIQPFRPAMARSLKRLSQSTIKEASKPVKWLVYYAALDPTGKAVIVRKRCSGQLAQNLSRKYDEFYAAAAQNKPLADQMFKRWIAENHPNLFALFEGVERSK